MESDSRTTASKAAHPLSYTEQAIAALWAEVLQTEELPRADDNFFSLGGDSMAMVMLEFRIQEELSVTIPPGAMLGAPSLRELSTLIDAHRRSNSSSAIDQPTTARSSGE